MLVSLACSQIRFARVLASSFRSRSRAGAKEGETRASAVEAQNKRPSSQVQVSASLTKPSPLPPLCFARRYLKTLSKFVDEPPTGWTDVPSGSPFVDMSMRFTSARKNDIVGRATSVVDCKPEIMLAFAFQFCSNELMRLHRERRDRARLEIPGHTMFDKVTAVVVKFPRPFQDR
jgi:hypothetical protein